MPKSSKKKSSTNTSATVGQKITILAGVVLGLVALGAAFASAPIASGPYVSLLKIEPSKSTYHIFGDQEAPLLTFGLEAKNGDVVFDTMWFNILDRSDSNADMAQGITNFVVRDEKGNQVGVTTAEMKIGGKQNQGSILIEKVAQEMKKGEKRLYTLHADFENDFYAKVNLSGDALGVWADSNVVRHSKVKAKGKVMQYPQYAYAVIPNFTVAADSPSGAVSNGNDQLVAKWYLSAIGPSSEVVTSTVSSTALLTMRDLSLNIQAADVATSTISTSTPIQLKVFKFFVSESNKIGEKNVYIDDLLSGKTITFTDPELEDVEFWSGWTYPIFVTLDTHQFTTVDSTVCVDLHKKMKWSDGFSLVKTLPFGAPDGNCLFY